MRNLWQIKEYRATTIKNGQYGQYLAPKGIGDKIYLPPIPSRIVDHIARLFNVPLPQETEPVWDWIIKHKTIPILITEGGKKALALLSLGIPAISLYGCNCGVQNKDKKAGVGLAWGQQLSIQGRASFSGSGVEEDRRVNQRWWCCPGHPVR